jgi:Amt family ammonium transporter
MNRIRVDDPVGAVPVHGLCGIWGTLAVGQFGQAVLGAPSDGLLYGGGGGLFVDQLIGGVAIAVFVTLTAGILFSALKAAGLLRVSAEEETAGLDVSEHGSPGYGPDILASASSI